MEQPQMFLKKGVRQAQIEGDKLMEDINRLSLNELSEDGSESVTKS